MFGINQSASHDKLDFSNYHSVGEGMEQALRRYHAKVTQTKNLGLEQAALKSVVSEPESHLPPGSFLVELGSSLLVARSVSSRNKLAGGSLAYDLPAPEKSLLL